MWIKRNFLILAYKTEVVYCFCVSTHCQREEFLHCNVIYYSFEVVKIWERYEKANSSLKEEGMYWNNNESNGLQNAVGFGEVNCPRKRVRGFICICGLSSECQCPERYPGVWTESHFQGTYALIFQLFEIEEYEMPRDGLEVPERSGSKGWQWLLLLCLCNF